MSEESVKYFFPREKVDILGCRSIPGQCVPFEICGHRKYLLTLCCLMCTWSSLLSIGFSSIHDLIAESCMSACRCPHFLYNGTHTMTPCGSDLQVEAEIFLQVCFSFNIHSRPSMITQYAISPYV